MSSRSKIAEDEKAAAFSTPERERDRFILEK
jgi:hypothetical protein